MTLAPLTRFTLASGATNLADGIAAVAWAWLATLLTRDALLIALVPVALRLPWFLFALPAGVVTDRADRRRLILQMDTLRALAFAAATAAVVLALPLAAPPARGVADPALFVLILTAAMIVGVAEVFRDNAAQTMLPSLVQHDRLEQANGRLWSIEMVGNALIGPALGALLIGLALPLPFAVNAAAMGIAVWLVAGMRGRFRPAQGGTRDWRAELRAGIAFMRAAPQLRLLAWLTGLWNLFYEMVRIALVLHAQENLGSGAATFGLILAAGAIGGILGGVLAAPAVRLLGPARAAQWSLASSAPAFLALAFAPGPVAVGLILAFDQLTGMIWNTVSVSYRQRTIPDALLGRVNSIYRMFAWGMMPLGLILSGLIVRATETVALRETALTAPFIVAGVGVSVVAAIGWRALGRGFGPGTAP